ncbi:MAG TPA: DMT family transporter [Anaeromyxobacter sp.]|nr:DMT family transporter [Anaeromyxobacter sp.]
MRDPDTLTLALEPIAQRSATPDPATAAAAHARRSRALGIAYVAASALCFGTLGVFGRLAYDSGADTQTLLLLRFGIASGIIWVVFAARRARLPRGRGLLVLAGMGGIGYAGQAFAFLTAVSLTSAGLAALLLYLYPALVAILSRVVLRHPLSRVQGLAIGVALLGSLLIVGAGGDAHPLGVACGLLAALIYAGYILAGSRLPADVTPTASAAVVTTSAAVVYGAVALVRGVRLPGTGLGWLAVLAIALVCTVLAIAFFLAGLERLGPVRASIYSTLEPPAAVIAGALVLGEQVTPLRVLGGALILGAVLLLARADHRG